MGAGPGPGGGTNPRPRSARNRRPSGAGSGARQGWRRGTAGALEAATVGQGPVGAGRGSDGVGERASVGAMHRRGRQLFAQAGKHRRNALLQRFDELLVHFEHLMQIGRRSIFHVIARASGAGHGELRCQSGGNIMGGNFIPMAGDGKQANRCRAPWLWARNGLSRRAHVSESRRTSVHHDTARGYRDHGLKSEHPFARANRIRTKRHSNPLSTWSKCHPIVCSEADAVCSPCVRLNARSMHTPLVWTSLCMTSDATWGTKAYFGSGATPRMRSDVQFAACAGMRMPQTSILPRHRTKDGSLPRTRLPISVAVFKSKPTPRKKAEASRAHRPLARSLSLPHVAQGRHERMTTPRAALAPQYNKSRERQLFRPSL